MRWKKGKVKMEIVKTAAGLRGAMENEGCEVRRSR